MKDRIDHLFLICALLGLSFQEDDSIIQDSEGMRTDQSKFAILFKKCMRRPTWSRDVPKNPDLVTINKEVKTVIDAYIKRNVRLEDENMYK